MKYAFLAVFAALCFSPAIALAGGEEGRDPELQPLIARIKAKASASEVTEADLAVELKDFEALLAKHKGEKTEYAAYMKYLYAMMFVDFLHDEPRGYTLLRQVSDDYPDANIANSAKRSLERATAADKLVVGTNFPDFFVLDSTGKPLELANYRGGVVLINFWASWSAACVAEAPDLTKIHEAHHGNDFEIIGINLDQEKNKMESFLATNKMAWPQIFDEGGHDSKIAPACHVSIVPMNFLLDGEGRIIARDIHGAELRDAVTQALAKKQAGGG